jgi:hypothetical protein
MGDAASVMNEGMALFNRPHPSIGVCGVYNFPLSQVHPYATHAAEAAVSVRAHAGEEAFWRMHDAIFDHQRDRWSSWRVSGTV